MWKWTIKMLQKLNCTFDFCTRVFQSSDPIMFQTVWSVFVNKFDVHWMCLTLLYYISINIYFLFVYGILYVAINDDDKLCVAQHKARFISTCVFSLLLWHISWSFIFISFYAIILGAETYKSHNCSYLFAFSLPVYCSFRHILQCFSLCLSWFNVIFKFQLNQKFCLFDSEMKIIWFMFRYRFLCVCHEIRFSILYQCTIIKSMALYDFRVSVFSLLL